MQGQTHRRALATEQPERFLKWTVPCDVHKAHQAHKSSFDLAAQDVSGMLATAVSQHGTGTLQTLRQILGTVLQQRLVIRYGEARDVAHREAVYDLYLPLSEQDALGREKPPRLSVMKRRMILARTLNGTLGDDEVQHWCGPGCCSCEAETQEKFQRFPTAALLPSKLPKFARNRWSHQFEAVSWCGLLAAHHSLLLPVVLAFTGAPTPAPAVAASSVQARNEAFMMALADNLQECDDQGEQAPCGWFGSPSPSNNYFKSIYNVTIDPTIVAVANCFARLSIDLKI